MKKFACNLEYSGQEVNTIFTNTPTGTSVTIDWNNGNMQELDLGSATGDVTVIWDHVNPGANLLLRVIQDSAVAIDISTWPATVKWTENIQPVITKILGGFDVISFSAWPSVQSASVAQNHLA